jgi:putative peptide zinc metalloprotease protein
VPTSPSLADGVELIGEYEGSGFKVPQSIVQRADGQVIQLPPLLYSVAAKIDGHHDVDEIASDVSDEIGRDLDASQVQYLIDDKLRPLGILTEPDGSAPTVEKPDPFLAFRFRVGVISERASGRLGSVFAPLFHPVVVIVALGAFVAADVWLFFVHGVAQSLRQTIYHPGYFLLLLAAIVIAAAFHETGHAAGCRYGGCHPGKMGAGLYLAWPAFYTDVTDAYRLNKRGRLRTDLGGVYFNVVVVLATMGLYAVTHLEPLLLVIIVQHLEIAHQLLPVIRLDGYYIVADMTGVPDLFSRMGPILRSLVPGHQTDEKVTVLKRWVRVAVTAWVLIIVPLLLFELGLVLMNLPRIIATTWDSTQQLWDGATSSFSNGDTLTGVSSVVQVVVLVIPLLGIMLMLIRLTRQLSVSMWKRTQGRPLARAAWILVAAGVLALLLPSWIQQKNYEPIQPNEKGTLPEIVEGTRAMWSTSAPVAQPEGPAPPSPTTPTSPPSPSGPAPANQPSSGGQAPPAPPPPVTTPELPPVTVPPVTVPPVTLPPVTVPPVTLPPVTVPPLPTTVPSAPTVTTPSSLPIN